MLNKISSSLDCINFKAIPHCCYFVMFWCKQGRSSASCITSR